MVSTYISKGYHRYGFSTRNIVVHFTDVISKFDVNDSTSMSPEVRSINSSIPSFFKLNYNTDDLRGLRVGVPRVIVICLSIFHF